MPRGPIIGGATVGHRGIRQGKEVWVVGLTAVLLAIGQGAIAAGWQEDEPERTEAGQLDDYETSSEDPDARTTGSAEAQVVDAEDPDREEASAGEMGDRMAAPGDLERQTTESRSLTNLPLDESGAEAEPIPIEVPGQSEWEPTTDPDVLVARRNLVRAQSRARAAIAAYGDMRRDDYPRGEARIRIVEERDAAVEALEAAKRALAEAERG
jgi:hypothetical protein